MANIFDNKFFLFENKGIQVVYDSKLNCYNATHLCKFYNKNLHHWFERKKTKELMNHLTFSYLTQEKTNDLYFENKIETDNNLVKRKIQGLYVYPEMFLDLALWISPECYINCFNLLLSNNNKEKYV